MLLRFHFQNQIELSFLNSTPLKNSPIWCLLNIRHICILVGNQNLCIGKIPLAAVTEPKLVLTSLILFICVSGGELFPSASLLPDYLKKNIEFNLFFCDLQFGSTEACLQNNLTPNLKWKKEERRGRKWGREEGKKRFACQCLYSTHWQTGR